MANIRVHYRDIEPDYDFALDKRSENVRPESNIRGDPYSSFYRRATEDLSRIKPKIHKQHVYGESFRTGRSGGPWRHIKQCTGSSGSHICFVDDGADDSQRYVSQSRNGRLGNWNHVVQTTGNRGEHITFINPSSGMVKQNDMEQECLNGNNNDSNQFESYMDLAPRTSGGYTSVRHPMLRPDAFVGGANGATPRAGNLNLDTRFNSRARKNFKYWHQEIPYQGLPAKQTISGRLMAKGIGF